MPRTGIYREIVESEKNFGDISKKAIYAGAIGAGAAYLLFNETGNSEFFNMQLPASVAAGAGTALGSVASDMLSGWVIDQMNQDDSIKSAESTAVKLGLAGVGSAVALKYGSGVDFSAESVMLGAGSKFAADAVWENIDPLGALW